MLVATWRKVKLRVTSGRPTRRKNLIQMPNSWPKLFSLPCKARNSIWSFTRKSPIFPFLLRGPRHKPRRNTMMNDPRIHAVRRK